MSYPSTASVPLNILAPKRKTKKKHFVQQKVEVFRASKPVLSVLMWGVNHSMNDLSQVPVPVILLPDDFKASTKIKVTNHLFNKENLPAQFKFKEYCPQVFRNLRERFGIKDQDYQVSVTRSPPVKNEERQTAGLLLTTFDRSLVVKEISSEEVEEIHSILSEYHQHIATCHGSTLLPQFLAMYRVTVESEDTHLLVMRNVFSHRLHIHTKYVLKVKDLPTYKDNDFKNSMQKVYVSDAEKKKFMDKLIRDTEFLVRMRIMDYSLLLGIHDVERAEKEEEEEMESSCEEDENSLALNPGSLSPEGIAGYINSFKPMGPGEFDPYVDVYAIQSTVASNHSLKII
ncbi:phosphatidylinositol 5-phosphate 4-kinase type-2 gamma-like isoform X2 [Thalassophryne amazonica]|uniref:phosphatidylinositol 5-phosphate 4-kinase type-2 gamma-like isoform X2 n=1 Tax=Thalassophryne amazonica TaxID=390379 RepID=UPI001470B05D|nr:phosphatidylinositol 5-phosphate 4-kinase type-2 gamma-like isoform X2 [Thalassophryne amazonica]